MLGLSPQIGHCGSLRNFISLNFIAQAIEQQQSVHQQTFGAENDLIVSVAWIGPTIPAAHRVAPPSAQTAPCPGGGGSGYRQR